MVNKYAVARRDEHEFQFDDCFTPYPIKFIPRSPSRRCAALHRLFILSIQKLMPSSTIMSCPRKLIASAALIGLLFSHCGFYSFSGTANPHLKTVAVPIFEDHTAEFGIKETLTNAIIAAYTRDNTLKIADRRNADSILSGTLLQVVERAGVYTETDQVQEIRVHLVVDLKYEDVKKHKTLWEGRLNQFGSYAPTSATSNDRQSAIAEAIDKIAREVINKTVSGW